MSDELDQDEFERAFEEAISAPKAKSRGRPPVPFERDLAVYVAVCTAHKRGYPLSPTGVLWRTTRRPSNLRGPGASTGKCSAFAIVARTLETYMTSRATDVCSRSLWAVGAYEVMSIYYRVAKRRALIESIILGGDIEPRLPVHTMNRIKRWKLRQGAAATKRRG